MMNSMFYDAMQKQINCKEDGKRVFEMMECILSLSCLAREEGLLALEEGVHKMFHKEEVSYNDHTEYEHYKLQGADRLLVAMINLVVDGTDPDELRQIGEQRYFASATEGREALAAYMVVIGCLSIQAGENNRLLEANLMSVLSDELEDQYISYKYKELEEKKKEKENGIPKEFFACDASIASKCMVIGTLEEVIKELDEQTIQRLLREISMLEWGLVIKGLSGSARAILFENMTERVQKDIYEDISYMGPVRMCDIEKAVSKVLKHIETKQNKGDSGQKINSVIAMYEHKVLQQNREIEFQIQQLKEEINSLNKQMIKM